MDVRSIFLELQRLLQLDFEEYASKIKKYEHMLQKEVKENPHNMRAVSLLSMVKFELRKSISTSLKYLEHSYNNFKDLLKDIDFCLLVTNMAYFYLEECINKEKYAKELLNEAIKRNSPFPQTYFALAMEYYEENQFELALPLYKKASDMTSLVPYHYNYAVCLNKCNRAFESIEILKKISEGYRKNEYKAKAYYSMGIIYSFLGEIEKARKIAFDLLDVDYSTLNIEHYMLADLMFLVGEFQQCIILYDKENLWETADWLSLYFYSQKEIDCKENALKKLQHIVNKGNMEIKDCKLEDFDGNEKDLNKYIDNERERVESIRTAYDNVFNTDIKPKIISNIDLIYVCYYIDCPRHMVDDI
ncbi:hypothetical protein [Tissierella praeacuta]|uniref:tetratricopeptide repeat protein n=1 Tax=Tissierella praeacuta TaxID=43131 RepID=UPI0033426D25